MDDASHCFIHSPGQLGQRRPHGQAMVEFVVFCGVVMTALFVIVPLFGKIMDMQFQTLQAARYVAWERTAWFDAGEAPGETTVDYVAMRSDNLVELSAANRFFHNSGRDIAPISQSDLGSSASGETSPLWTYTESKQPMFDSVTVENLGADRTPAFAYDVLDVFNTGMGILAAPVTGILSILGGDNDDFLTIAHETRNYYNPQVTTQLHRGNAESGNRSPESWLYVSGWDGSFRARAAILADGWNAQSEEHFKQRVDDLVPSTLFDNGLINTVKDVASLLDSSLDRMEFGWVGTDPIPDADVSCFMGYCYFDE